MSSNAIPDQHRRLAEALEAAEAAGVEVDGVESFTVDGELVATVDVGIGEQTEHTNQSTADGIVDADASAVDPADEPAPSTPAESDITPGDLEDEGNTQDSDEEFVESVHEVAEGVDLDDDDQDDQSESDADTDDEQPHPNDLEAEADDLPATDSLAGEILATLCEEGELAGPEIKTLSGAGTDMYTALGKLEDDELIDKRKDPDDGRRTLYSAADWLVEDEDEDDQDEELEWNGRDPETIVADSSLPARVVLEDILDAVANADTVIDVAEQLEVNVDNLESVCWHLTLKEADSLAIVGNVDERVETIREVVSA